MKNYFLGIDVSKDFFDVVIVDYKATVVEKGLQYSNDDRGLNKFRGKLRKFNHEDLWICIESTGCYGYLINQRLSEWNYNFSVENPLSIKRSVGITRGKDDQVDAFRIARYAQMNQYQLTPYKMPLEALRKLKEYLRARDMIVKQRTQIKNRLSSLKISSKSTDLQELIELTQSSLRSFSAELKVIERMIMTLIESDEQIQKTYNKITKIKGVGVVTAATIIVETECFQRSQNARAFNCHCGLAPFKYESGSSVKGKTQTSSFRKRKLKTVLFNAASSAIQHEPQLRAYYKRKLGEGKHKCSALNAVANKLVLRIFAVALRDEEWVELRA